MAKPGRKPKTTEEMWYDIFADADLSEQVIMLQILQGIHRQARRGRLASIPAPKELMVSNQAEEPAGTWADTLETGAKQ